MACFDENIITVFRFGLTQTYSTFPSLPSHTSIGAKTLFDFCGFRGGLRDFAFGMASWLLFLGPSCCGNDTIALATQSLSKGLEAKT